VISSCLPGQIIYLSTAQGSGVERSGAAQGLAEVLGVLGPEYLAGLLPDILASCTANSAVAREGSLTLFKFLPLAVPDECQVRPGLRLCGLLHERVGSGLLLPCHCMAKCQN